MKKILSVLYIATLLFASCSDEYDDSALTGRVDNLENRVAKLEELCKQMNTNISSLQTIVTALQKNDYVTNVTPIMQNGKEVGYTITFSKSNPITIYHGKDGQNGTDGEDGKPGVDGEDGKNGHTPVIGVKQDTDGSYYWTLDGDWLTDDSGNKKQREPMARMVRTGRMEKTGMMGRTESPAWTAKMVLPLNSKSKTIIGTFPMTTSPRGHNSVKPPVKTVKMERTVLAVIRCLRILTMKPIPTM